MSLNIDNNISKENQERIKLLFYEQNNNTCKKIAGDLGIPLQHVQIFLTKILEDKNENS